MRPFAWGWVFFAWGLALPAAAAPTLEQVIVEIPESEIDAPPATEALDAYAADLVARRDAIRHAPLPPDADQPPLTPKQIERFDAFALREDR